MDGLEIAQVLPGPNILNLAVYCGQRVRGIPGAAAAFLGASVPPFIIVLIAGALYFKFAKNPYVHGGLLGCAAGALGLTLGNALELTWDERTELVTDRSRRRHRIGCLVLEACRCCSSSSLFGGAGIVHEYAALLARSPMSSTLQTATCICSGPSRSSPCSASEAAKASFRKCTPTRSVTYHWVTSAAVYAVLHHRQTRTGADDDLRGPRRLRSDALHDR